MMLLLVAVIGCGGGGETGTTGGDTGGSGGNGDRDATIAYQLEGVGATFAGNIDASATPQTVTVNVGGVTRTISNVIVPYNIRAAFGTEVTILKAGSRLLNMDIPNAAAGLSFEGSAVRAPVSSTGVLGVNVLADGDVVCRTPPGTWQGYSLPNGLAVRLMAVNAPGDVRATMNAAVKMPTTATGSRSGTTMVSYASPADTGRITANLRNGAVGVEVNTGTAGQGQVVAGPSAAGTITAPWTAFGQPGATGLTDAFVIVLFN
ncbi:MAG: hypothetical protein ACO1SV_15310 [Fimbriimonas sp.]